MWLGDKVRRSLAWTSKREMRLYDTENTTNRREGTMESIMPDRRGLLRGALAASVIAIVPGARPDAQEVVRWSAGTEAPKIKAPTNATDCHFHIYDSSLPIARY